jgi:SurA-like protein
MNGRSPSIHRRGPGSGIVTGAVVILVAVGVLAGSWLSRAWSAEPDAVVRVNGDPVTRAEWIAMVGDLIARREAKPEAGAGPPESDDVARRALQHVIARRLVLQEAARRNVTATDQEVDQATDNLARQFKDAGRLLGWLRARGLDTRSLHETMRAEVVIARVRDAVMAQARVTEERQDVFMAWLVDQEKKSKIEVLVTTK